MEHNNLLCLLTEWATTAGIKITANQIKQFQAYLEQLQAWNRATNLTSITDEEEIVIKHFIDSLSALKAEDLKVGAALLDVGSGAGFPGIPLKIVRPDLHLTLLEPVTKKASFLHFIIGHLRLESVEVFAGTLEKFAAESSTKSFDYIVSRALKHDFILSQSLRLLGRSGRVILYLSKPFVHEDSESAWSVIREFSLDLPKGKGHRVISVLAA